MEWIYLVISALLEPVWAVALKRAEGWSRPGPSLFAAVSAVLGFYLLGLALRTLPAGTAYVVWVGIGAAATAAVGILALGEPATLLRLGSIALILLGVLGLRWAGS